MVLNATFVQQMESEKIAAFSILVNDDSQELALRVFTQDEARTLDEEFLQNNNLCALKQAKEEKNKSQRINIVSAMQRRPWLQELMAQVDEHKRRRYPKWDEDESAYILQAAE